MTIKELQPMLNQASKFRLTEQEELAYLRIANDASISPSVRNMAFNKIVSNHILFVVSCAKKFVNKATELSDLINEGIIGLRIAIKQYDLSRHDEISFLSYAVWWIMQKIKMYAFVDCHLIKVPTNRRAMVQTINRNLNNGKTIDDLKLSDEDMEMYEHVSNIINPMSLNAPLKEDNDTNEELMDVISGYDMNTEIKDDLLKRNINLIMEDLTDKEKDIINKYYTLNGELPLSHVEIGELMGYSREHIRKLKLRILHKLRAKLKGKKLDEFLEG